MPRSSGRPRAAQTKITGGVMPAVMLRRMKTVGVADFNVGEMRKHCLSLARDCGRLLDELVAKGDFSEDWPYIRAFVPLQIRLVCEQIMWDRGGDWRQYVTGFRPVDRSIPGSGVLAKMDLEDLKIASPTAAKRFATQEALDRYRWAMYKKTTGRR